MTGRGWSFVVAGLPIACLLVGVCWVFLGWVGWSWCAVLGL